MHGHEGGVTKDSKVTVMKECVKPDLPLTQPRIADRPMQPGCERGQRQLPSCWGVDCGRRVPPGRKIFRLEAREDELVQCWIKRASGTEAGALHFPGCLSGALGRLLQAQLGACA